MSSEQDEKRGAALAQAMDLFWTCGAETASYNDIVEATGLSRKALYGLWPDKDALVRDSLRHYREHVLGAVMAPLAKGGAAGLKAFWAQLEAAARGKSWRGCFLFRTASGPMRTDRYITDMLNVYVDELGRAIAAEVRQGQADGQLDPHVHPDHAGRQSMALNSLISVVGAQDGFNAQVRDLFATARVSCGLMSER